MPAFAGMTEGRYSATLCSGGMTGLVGEGNLLYIIPATPDTLLRGNAVLALHPSKIVPGWVRVGYGLVYGHVDGAR